MWQRYGQVACLLAIVVAAGLYIAAASQVWLRVKVSGGTPFGLETTEWLTKADLERHVELASAAPGLPPSERPSAMATVYFDEMVDWVAASLIALAAFAVFDRRVVVRGGVLAPLAALLALHFVAVSDMQAYIDQLGADRRVVHSPGIYYVAWALGLPIAALAASPRGAAAAWRPTSPLRARPPGASRWRS